MRPLKVDDDHVVVAKVDSSFDEGLPLRKSIGLKLPGSMKVVSVDLVEIFGVDL